MGVRTEIDHASKTVTQEQTALILKAASKFKWDGRARYSPPTTKGLKPLAEGTNICPIFHKQYRAKVVFLAHVALLTRVDLAYHAVELARQLVRPSEEADKFADETMQFLFSTADQRLQYDCRQPLGRTLVISSDASLADTEQAKTTGG